MASLLRRSTLVSLSVRIIEPQRRREEVRRRRHRRVDHWRSQSGAPIRLHSDFRRAADFLQAPRRHAQEILSAKSQFARDLAAQSGQQPQDGVGESRFAGAGFAANANGFSVPDDQVQTIEHRQPGAALRAP